MTRHNPAKVVDAVGQETLPLDIGFAALRLSCEGAAAIRIAVVLVILCVLLALTMTFPATVYAPDELSLQARVSRDIADASRLFGTPSAGNHCPKFFGDIQVRPDRVVILRIHHAERVATWDRRVREVLAASADATLYAWVDPDEWAMFLTDRFWRLPREERLALLFHEVRGHWELRLTDTQMLRVLVPGSVNTLDTHQITRAIQSGCQALQRKSTEDAYTIALSAGPLLPE